MYKFGSILLINNHEYDSRVNTFKIPETWVELSTDQAAKLAEFSEETAKYDESEAKAYVQDGMVKAMTGKSANEQSRTRTTYEKP